MVTPFPDRPLFPTHRNSKIVLESRNLRTHSSGDRLRRLIITQSEADLTSNAGLGLIGMALNACTNLVADAEGISPMRSDAMPHASILSSYIALLCLGKSDFEAINGFREDEFFATALGLEQVPSEGTLRQRMDDLAREFKPVVEDAAMVFLQRSAAQQR
jgi:hypothetical protein